LISALLLLLAGPAAGAGTGLPFGTPAVTTWVAPDYPPMAVKARLEGTVAVRVEVAPNGEVRSASLVGKGLPMGLAAASLAAAKQWRFAGDAAAVHEVRLELSFSLYPYCGPVHAAEAMGAYHVRSWARSPRGVTYSFGVGGCREVVETCPSPAPDPAGGPANPPGEHNRAPEGPPGE